MLEALELALVRHRRFWQRPQLKQLFYERLGESIAAAHLVTLRAIEQSEGEPNIRQVAAMLDIDASTASRNVAALVDAGYVDRTASGEDRRNILLVVTSEGERLLERANAVRHELLAEMTADWPALDVAALARLLSRLADAAQDLESRS